MISRSFLKATGVFLLLHSALSQNADPYSPTATTLPGAFPTSVYSSYYNDPTATSAQPQPVISDPVTHEIYPYNLTDPNTIPGNDTLSPHPLPPVASSDLLLEAAFNQIVSIASNPVFADTCTQCQAALEVGKFIAMTRPELGSPLAVRVCEYFNYSSTLGCETDYGIYYLGSVVTQIASYADVGGYDGQGLCWHFLGLCPRPPTSPLDLTNWFAKPKPDPLPPPKQPSGQLIKVLHLSDMHLDPRYTNGAEANCSSYLCCRDNVYNADSPDEIVLPASRYGAYSCDTPYSLMWAALEAIPTLTGTEETPFDFMVYTGDLVSHDPDNQLSRQYVMYTETVMYDLMKRLIGNNPVYPVLGNHDTHNEAQNAPYSMGGYMAEQFNWDYDHVSSLWQIAGWLPESAVLTARTHYAAYMVERADGLRIIALNTNFWYDDNYYNYLNQSTSDPSGVLRFVTDELQDAEDAGARVWIMGHVLSGWDGTNALMNPTNLFYQIVDRYSPHVIAAIFFGHTHEDQFEIFYANNGTNMSVETAQTVAWICPSLTPLTNLNSGFRVYEVDSATFDIVNAYTWKADVNSFPALDNQTAYGPTYSFEYSTREAYGESVDWCPNEPLNATWWHLVTEAMEANSTLVSLFNTYQGKGSIMTEPCTGECAIAKVCYMRSGSSSLAYANCPAGYGSVQ
ncbi:Metallo-dependent phosphatase [Sparassis latifolia]